MPKAPCVPKVRGQVIDCDIQKLQGRNSHGEEESERDDGSSRRASRGSRTIQIDHHQKSRNGRLGLGLSHRDGTMVNKNCRGARENLNPKTNVIEAVHDNTDVDEAVQSVVLYLLLVHHKKLPIKRTDIVKYGLNGRGKNFAPIMEKVKNVLLEMFGIEVVGVDAASTVRPSSSYIMVSSYPMSATDLVSTKSLEAQTKQAVLFLILTFSFMQRCKLGEEHIWKCCEQMLVGSGLVKMKEDLRRFLKQEFVTTLYLEEEEINVVEQRRFQYSWGLRAEKEFTKQAILDFVRKEQTEIRPDGLCMQYQMASEADGELEHIDSDDMEIQGTADDADDIEV